MRSLRVRIVRVREKPGWEPRITDHVVVDNVRLIIKGAAVVTVVDGHKKSRDRNAIKSASRREREQAEESL